MVGLLDIVPAEETVEAGGQSVRVIGISALGLGHLLGRFPELRMLMSGQEVSVDRLMEIGGEAVAAIIAAGCGYPGNPDAERVSVALPVGEQADLLGAIIRLTMPQGVGPFMEKLTALSGALDSGNERTQAFKVRPMKLRRVS